MMRRLFFYTILLLGLPLMLNGQVYKDDLGGYVSFATVDKNGDTIPMYFISDIVKYPPLKSKKLEKFYWKTVRDVKKVYPYVKIVGKEYARIQRLADTIPDPKEREAYLKKYEKALLKQYEPIMRKFTLSQGKMMIKLIDRECDKSSYAIIKEIRGGFVAWWWQAFAKFVGADLKEDYDIEKKEKDRIIERVIELYEAGLL